MRCRIHVRPDLVGSTPSNPAICGSKYVELRLWLISRIVRKTDGAAGADMRAKVLKVHERDEDLEDSI